jgi:transcription elongation factor Elf1
MPTTEPGIMHAYLCPHCRKVQQLEVALDDKRQLWNTSCDSCGKPVIIRYDPKRDGVDAIAP